MVIFPGNCMRLVRMGDPCPALPCPSLSCLALSCPSLPFPSLPFPSLPCPALPCLPALPYPALPACLPVLPCCTVVAVGFLTHSCYLLNVFRNNKKKKVCLDYMLYTCKMVGDYIFDIGHSFSLSIYLSFSHYSLSLFCFSFRLSLIVCLSFCLYLLLSISLSVSLLFFLFMSFFLSFLLAVPHCLCASIFCVCLSVCLSWSSFLSFLCVFTADQ